MTVLLLREGEEQTDIDTLYLTVDQAKAAAERLFADSGWLALDQTLVELIWRERSYDAGGGHAGLSGLPAYHLYCRWTRPPRAPVTRPQHSSSLGSSYYSPNYFDPWPTYGDDFTGLFVVDVTPDKVIA